MRDRDSSPSGSAGYLAALCSVAALGGLLFGFDTAVISGTIVYLRVKFELSAGMEGWTLSAALVGCIVGAMIAGALSDRFGRRRVLSLAALLFLLSAVGSALPRTLAELIVARVVGGVGVGIASVLSPLYIAEVSPPHVRGRLVSLYQLAIVSGMLVAYFTNALFLYLAENAAGWFGEDPWRWFFVDEVWRAMFGCESLPAALFIALLFFVPESPRWLTKQGRVDSALGILARVGGRATAEREVAEIQEAISLESGSVLQLLRPGLRVVLLIGVVLAILQQITGINVILYYGPRIFEEAGFQLSSALGGQVSIGAINLLSTIIAVWVIDRLGRKPLLQAGTVGMGLALVLVGLLFRLNQKEGPGLLILFLTYVGCFAFSMGPVVWVILSEIFPTRVRGRAMSIATVCLWAACFLVSQTFPWLLETLGAARTFWLYAAMCVVSLVFVGIFVPETKRRTLEQIEKHWLGAPATGTASPARPGSPAAPSPPSGASSDALGSTPQARLGSPSV